MKNAKTSPIYKIALVTILFSLIGGAYSYMFKQTNQIDNEFKPAQVSCIVNESVDSPLTKKSSITVKNTSNIDVYIRIRLVNHWVDSNNNIVSKPSEKLLISTTDNWISEGTNTYYYLSPISPNESVELLNSELILYEIDSNGYRQVVEVFAEAIQANPTHAVEESWGVTVNSDKTLSN